MSKTQSAQLVYHSFEVEAPSSNEGKQVRTKFNLHNGGLTTPRHIQRWCQGPGKRVAVLCPWIVEGDFY